MDCQRVEDLISMYIEHELPRELHREISLHLQQCDHCRELKEKVESLIEVFPALEEEVPFFLRNRLYYIPESQDRLVDRQESRFNYLKWLAAAIGTFVLFLNLFYFTNLYPPAKRILHTMVAQVKSFTVGTEAFFDEVRASDGVAILSFLQKDPDRNGKIDKETEPVKKNHPPVEDRKLDIEKKIENKEGGHNG